MLEASHYGYLLLVVYNNHLNMSQLCGSSPGARLSCEFYTALNRVINGVHLITGLEDSDRVVHVLGALCRQLRVSPCQVGSGPHPKVIRDDLELHGQVRVPRDRRQKLPVTSAGVTVAIFCWPKQSQSLPRCQLVAEGCLRTRGL